MVTAWLFSCSLPAAWAAARKLAIAVRATCSSICRCARHAIPTQLPSPASFAPRLPPPRAPAHNSRGVDQHFRLTFWPQVHVVSDLYNYYVIYVQMLQSIWCLVLCWVGLCNDFWSCCAVLLQLIHASGFASSYLEGWSSTIFYRKQLHY